MSDKREFNTWHCSKCNKTMSQDEFVEHLEKEHGIKETSGTRSMISHADAKDFYDWKYKWEIGDLEFIQHTRTLRRGADKEMWDNY